MYQSIPCLTIPHPSDCQSFMHSFCQGGGGSGFLLTCFVPIFPGVWSLEFDRMAIFVLPAWEASALVLLHYIYTCQKTTPVPNLTAKAQLVM